MYEGFVEYGGVEIVNVARTVAYVKANLPNFDVSCDVTGLQAARNHTAYTSPALNGAPWYSDARPATGRFYGLFPGRVEGAEDGTRSSETIELLGDGAVHHAPRHASREIRLRATAFALDDEAMGEGLAWLRDVLMEGDCSTGDCEPQQLKMYRAQPVGGAASAHLLRTFYAVEVKEFKRVGEYAPTKGVLREVEILFSAGNPWAYTPEVTMATLVLANGSSVTDGGENCYEQNGAFSDFVDDPYYTAISLPPRPPVVKPPNLLDVSSWRRSSAAIPTAEAQRWGRAIPSALIVAGSAGAKMVRLRYWAGSLRTGCGYDGEFLIPYIPPNATLEIDGPNRRISVIQSSGKRVAGGHLVYGSDGLPLKWPVLGCTSSYTLTADMMPGQSGISVIPSVSVRE